MSSRTSTASKSAPSRAAHARKQVAARRTRIKYAATSESKAMQLNEPPLADTGTLLMESLLARSDTKPVRYDSSPFLNRAEDHQHRDRLQKRFASRLVVNPALTRRLVSFQASKQVPFYRWLKYKEAFSPELVDYLFDHLQPANGAAPQVLDPFAGTGTVLTRASVRGWHATGIELLPVGVHALNARFTADRVSAKSFAALLATLAKLDWKKPKPGWRFPHLRITQAAFSANTESDMSAYLRFVDGIADADARFLFWFACLSVLEDVSFTRKDGQYLRWDERSGREHVGQFNKGRIPDFRTAVTERLREFHEDLMQRNGSLFSKMAKVIEGSCLHRLAGLEAGSFDAVLTSPPYCNRYDYTRTYALELAFCGCGEEDIRKLRQTLLSATVENRSKRDELRAFYEGRGQLPMIRAIEKAFSGQAALHEVLHLLRAARDRGELSNPNVPALVENYFFEMTAVIFELARALKRGGTVMMVNDNVQYHGEDVPVDLILSDLAEQAGLEVEKIWVLPRGKGNSSQQMGRWGRTELRKCVYLWRKPKWQLTRKTCPYAMIKI